MSVYYNDSDAFVCAWLRNLIDAKLLPAGDVDERPIEQVQASDVAGYTQCHFFAGIGGWPYALQLAGWGDRPVWTGSCPCQPFSPAGRQRGHADDRHLWPAWHRLIEERRPTTVFGEQVSSRLGRAWLAAVRADLEALDYAVGGADLCAAGVGAPHIRQRLWFVGDAKGRNGGLPIQQRGSQQGRAESRGPGQTRGMDDTASARRDGAGQETEGETRDETRLRGSECGRTVGELADATSEQARIAGLARQPWDAVDWLPCRDGKARPVEPGTFPLAHGIPQRVGRLRAYGNAINPYTAAAFVSAYMEIAP